jgi:hypothetical protein
MTSSVTALMLCGVSLTDSGSFVALVSSSYRNSSP